MNITHKSNTQYKNNLYVFGASTVLYSTKDDNDVLPSQEYSWANIVANNIGFNLYNYGVPSVDNDYIARTFISKFSKISSDDIVVIGWTHFSRFMFYKTIIDDDLLNQSITKKPHDIHSTGKWIRSRGNRLSIWKGGMPNLTQVFGDKYYDYFFKHYYDNTSFLLNTLEKMLLASYMLNSKKIKYLFLTDRTIETDIEETSFMIQMVSDMCDFCEFDGVGMIDFVENNNKVISINDSHPNIEGQTIIASKITEHLNGIS